MGLDPRTVLVISAVVVTVAGVMFISETVIRRDNGASRLWAVGFLAPPVALLADVVATGTPGVRWAFWVGRAALVAMTVALWLGCRRFNERRMREATTAGIVSVVLVAAVGMPGAPTDRLGAVVASVGLAVFAGLGCAECMRGDLRASRTAAELAAVLGPYALFHLARATALAVGGTGTVRFWMSPVPDSIAVVVVTVVALTATSVLRAGRTPVRGIRDLKRLRGREVARLAQAMGADSGVLVAGQFWISLQGVLGRAGRRDELVAVFAVHIEDLSQTAIAFGTEAAADIVQALRRGVRRNVPAAASVGEDGPGALLSFTVVGSAADARRIAGRIAEGVFEELRAVPDVVLPEVRVGMALTDTHGYGSAVLVDAAQAASVRGKPVADAADGVDPSRP